MEELEVKELGDLIYLDKEQLYSLTSLSYAGSNGVHSFQVQGYTAYEAVRDDIHFLDLILDTSSFRFSCIHISKVYNSSLGIDINDPGNVRLLTRAQSVSIDEDIVFAWEEQGATALLPGTTDGATDDGRRKLLGKWSTNFVQVRSYVRSYVQAVVAAVVAAPDFIEEIIVNTVEAVTDFTTSMLGSAFSFTASPGEGELIQDLAQDLYEATFVMITTSYFFTNDVMVGNDQENTQAIFDARIAAMPCIQADYGIALTFEDNVIFNRDTSAEALMQRSNKTNDVFLSIKGSKELKDWTHDLAMFKRDVGDDITCSDSVWETNLDCGKVHNGFMRQYASIKDDIVSKAAVLLQEAYDHSASYPDWKFVITGHSLGASLATVATFDLAQTESLNRIVGGGDPNRDHVASQVLAKKIIHVSWEGPAVGDKDFVFRYKQLGIASTTRIVNGVYNENRGGYVNDPVAATPLSSSPQGPLGYRHISGKTQLACQDKDSNAPSAKIKCHLRPWLYYGAMSKNLFKNTSRFGSSDCSLNVMNTPLPDGLEDKYDDLTWGGTLMSVFASE